MYKCEKCGESSKPNQRAITEVVERVEKRDHEGNVYATQIKKERKLCYLCAGVTETVFIRKATDKAESTEEVLQ